MEKAWSQIVRVEPGQSHEGLEGEVVPEHSIAAVSRIDINSEVCSYRAVGKIPPEGSTRQFVRNSQSELVLGSRLE
jgi:hypothetical protein